MEKEKRLLFGIAGALALAGFAVYLLLASPVFGPSRNSGGASPPSAPASAAASGRGAAGNPEVDALLREAGEASLQPADESRALELYQKAETILRKQNNDPGALAT
ncbi:MAG: hypothetical protein V1918_06630, partial [Planctomycetota bacterium]